MRESAFIEHPTAVKEDSFLATEEIRVHHLRCDECISTLEELFMSVDGVQFVRINENDQNAEVTFDTRKTSLPVINDILLRSGYKEKNY
jgi:copper chaperone CopZ